MSRTKSTPTPPPSWDAALHALAGAQGQEAASGIALTTGLVLALRATVPATSSPSELRPEDERAFLRELPSTLVPAGRDVLRALRRVARPHARDRRGR